MPNAINTLLRLALVVALDMGAVGLALYQHYMHHDTGAAFACFIGLAFASWMVAPDKDQWRSLAAEIQRRKQE